MPIANLRSHPDGEWETSADANAHLAGTRKWMSVSKGWSTLGKWPIGLVAWTLVLLSLLLVVAAAPILAPYDPLAQSLARRMQPPMWADGGSTAHILGTDSFGRDVLSRLIHGTRFSMAVAGLTIAVGVAIGAPLGLLAGYRGGVADIAIMRAVDVFLAIPTVLVAIAIAVALGPSMRNLVLVISLTMWPKIARQMRGEALAIRTNDYVTYARAVGVSQTSILVRHVLPNAMPTLLVVSTLEIGSIILTESTLSFLGAGVPRPAPSWGTMVADGRGLLASGWWLALLPGLAIVLAVSTFNSIGDGLRDFLDPRLKDT